METKIQDFIGRMQTPINKMGVKELREREQIWRSLWSWIPENVKYLTYRIGSMVRIIRRDYKGNIGELGDVNYEPSMYEVTVYEKRYNETDGKWYYEHKVIKIPATSTMMMEFVMDMELAENVDVEEVSSVWEPEEPQDSVADLKLT